jgi:hypothetical protein
MEGMVMDFRDLLQVVFIATTILMIPMIHPARAENPTFTWVDYHFKPVIRYAPAASFDPKPYEAGYMSPISGQPAFWTVEGTRVTVSFPNTQDPSVLGLGNWIAAGMYVTGWDLIHHWNVLPPDQPVDWGYYTVVALSYTGELYLEAGIYRALEGTGQYSDICIKTWQIGGVPRSTPITLTTMWVDDRYIDWSVTIDGVIYNPPDSIFDMSGQDKPRPDFVVGVCDLETWKWWLAPYYKCYFFQFGIQSPYYLDTNGWNARLAYPSYYENGAWNYVQQAQSMGGQHAFLDSSFRWGGTNYQGINAYTEQYLVTFHWTGDRIPDNTYLWIPNGGGGGMYCPFVSVWDGRSYVLDNNVLPGAELSNGTDVEDYYRLERALIPENGKYSLLVSEFESEHSYFDQVKLIAIDHNSDVNVAVAPDGEILTYKTPAAPISAIDNNGSSRLNEISLIDGNVSDPDTYFYGVANDFLVLNFGQVNSDSAKLILRDDMKTPWECIYIQVRNGNGVWQTVAVANPRSYWSIEAFDLSSYVIQGQDLLVRLFWAEPHRLDFVGLDTTTQEDYELRTANLVSATHSTQGDVKALLKESDNTYAELIPNQQIQLTFTLPNNSKEARTYILYTKGRYQTITP